MKNILAICATALLTTGTIGIANAQDVTAPTAHGAPAVGDTAPLQIMTGESVYNTDGDEIGSVEEIAVGADGSQTVILSVGEFLGLGGKMVAVPASELSARADGGYSVSYTADQLQSMPEHAAP
ncbi:MAG: hypothetical protein RJB62_625 [Pseudomonadota bacterium]|jgi:hypothetical protein